MVCRVCENAYTRQNQPSLALTEGEDDETHFSGPPRRWGRPEWSGKAVVCRVRKNACTRQTQPSLALTEDEDDEAHFSGLPRRWGGFEWCVASSSSRG